MTITILVSGPFISAIPFDMDIMGRFAYLERVCFRFWAAPSLDFFIIVGSDHTLKKTYYRKHAGPSEVSVLYL
jgi:hypothetical protein